MGNIQKSAGVTYNRCRNWQMGFFALNNTATNCYMFMMNYISYYAVGVAGLLTSIVGIVITGMRIFDGITDPVIGYVIDRTDGKIGKFRPFIMLGNLILAVMSTVIYTTTHLIPEPFRLVYFIACYAVYIVGYTFQTACTKAGQNCLTNDPKQRPLFSMFDGAYNTVLFVGLQVVISGVLLPGFSADGKTMDMGFFRALLIMTVTLSAVCTALAVCGIWSKDRTEFFGTGKAVKVKFKEYLDVIRHNRAIQMLVVAASTDKLAGSVMQNSILTVVLFGIMIGDYKLSGTMSFVTLIPTLLLGLFLMNKSRKTGMKKAIVVSSAANIVIYLAFGAVMMLGDATRISLSSISFMTAAYVVLTVLRGAVGNVSSNLVIPMISDCADYETYRSGRYVPGMMGTLFSFVDKMISSLSATIISLYLAAIGYATVLPQIGDAMNVSLKMFWFVMAILFPVVGLACNLIAMKFYPLTKEKMEEIQETIAEIKEKTLTESE